MALVIGNDPIRTTRLGVLALVIGDDPAPAAKPGVWTLVIANDHLRLASRPPTATLVIVRFPQFVVWSRNQATVAPTASSNGVAVHPKARWNLVLSTTHGRSD